MKIVFEIEKHDMSIKLQTHDVKHKCFDQMICNHIPEM